MSYLWCDAQASLLLFAKPSVCVCQKNATLVGSLQVLRQFVYKKRETVVGSHKLPPNFKAAVHVNQHNPSVSEQTLWCRQRRLEMASRLLCASHMDCALALPQRNKVAEEYAFDRDDDVRSEGSF